MTVTVEKTFGLVHRFVDGSVGEKAGIRIHLNPENIPNALAATKVLQWGPSPIICSC